MRIVQSQVGLASSRVASTSDFSKPTIEAWVGKRPSQAAKTTVASGQSARSASQIAAGLTRATAGRAAPAAVANLSADARSGLARLLAAQSGLATSSTSGVLGAADPGDDGLSSADPEMRILAMLVEALTGHKVRILNPADIQTNAEGTAQAAGKQAAAAQAAAASASSGAAAPAQQPAGWGVDVQVEQVHQESETTGYEAAGKVVTADGGTINFDFTVLMQRDLVQSVKTEVQAGDAVKKVDPIALNLNGGSVALSETRTGFDINSDGAAEQVALPAAGTYFLALDRNGNGRIDNGSELFGPSSGDGFAEMRSLDTDGNGWIDEGDAAYASLRLWSGPQSETQSLADAGVGALYVRASTATQFDLRSGSNETLGQVRSSSVYLSENGRPGALAQVDLTA